MKVTGQEIYHEPNEDAPNEEIPEEIYELQDKHRTEDLVSNPKWGMGVVRLQSSHVLDECD